MSFPWERRLKVIEELAKEAAETQKMQAARADAQAVTKQIAHWYSQHAAKPTAPVIPGDAP